MSKKLLLLLMLLFLFSCREQEKPKEGPTQKQPTKKEQAQQIAAVESSIEKIDIEKEIVAFPNSPLSIKSAIVISFRDNMVSRDEVGEALATTPFSFDKKIKGHVQWTSANVLSFIPDEPLTAGATIKGTLKASELFGTLALDKEVKFSFDVAKQEILYITGDFEAVEGKMDVVRYKGTLTFAQPVTLSNVQKSFKAKGPKGKLMATLGAGGKGTEITVVTGELKRNSTPQEIVFTLPEEYTPNKEKWQKSIILPEAQTFRIMAHMDQSDTKEGTKAYGFLFSDPIKKGTDLSGYVSITPEVKYSVKTTGKTLKVIGNFIPGLTYDVTIRKGLSSSFGTKLSEAYNAEFALSNIKPKIEWVTDGIFLPSDNKSQLQFKSVNIKKASLQVFEIHPQNLGFFIQTNSIEYKKQNDNYYDDDYYYDYYYDDGSFRDLNRVGVSVYSQDITIDSKKNNWSTTSLDLSPIFKGKEGGAFVVTLKFDKDDLTGDVVNDLEGISDSTLYFENEGYYQSPDEWGYYSRHGTHRKLVISSDVGLTMKRDSKGFLIAATDLVTAKPIEGLKLTGYTYQNFKVETAVTDKEGFARFNNGSNDPSEIYYFYGLHKSGVALIKKDHSKWPLNSFDISGITSGTSGTDLFIYADRGVHRPGDTVFLSAIVRMNQQNPKLGLPVTLEITNPNGQTAFKEVLKCGDNGMVHTPFVTDMSAPTGSWTAHFRVGGSNFYHTLRIETVKPHRIKIAVDVPETITGEVLEGTFESKYLFGTPAKGLKTDGRVTLRAKHFSSRKYPKFNFNDPLKYFETREGALSTGVDGSVTDDEGKGEIYYELPSSSVIPSQLSATGFVRVYEKGGSFVKKSFSTTISPYGSFIGVQDPFKWNWATTDEKHNIPLVVLDNDGKPVSGNRVEVKVYFNRRYWWWHYGQDRKDFRERESTYLIENKELISTDGIFNYELEVNDNGRYYIEVTDLESGHSSGLFFYASRYGEEAQDDKDDEHNLLKMKLDKKNYYTGETATISFKAPDSAAALLTIEQGDRILYRTWGYEENGKISIPVELTDDMVPNVYASVSLIQPHTNKNDLPLRLFGVKPIFVKNPANTAPISVQAPNELRPGETFEVNVENHGVDDATYTIAIVDEGLLTLTDFVTPNPWNHYFQRRGLSVSTSDNFEDVYGALLPDTDRMLAIGGDAMQQQKRVDKNKTRRFKPVVLFQAPVTLKGKESKKVSFTMPNYVGAVRMMVVATANHSYKSVEKVIPVKQPLMILPTIPRVIRPADKFYLPVSVFAMDSTIKEATVSIQISGNLSAQEKSKKLTFSSVGEKDLSFLIEVGNKIGADTIIVTAISGNEKITDTTHLPVISANPYYTDVQDTVITKGSSVTYDVEKFGFEGTNTAYLQITRVPDIQLSKRLKDLIRYPYGCIEQTTSSTFPQLYLENLLDLTSHQKSEATDNVNRGIKRLSTFQVNGGFAYWPVSRYYNRSYSNWGTLYAGHFLVEAKTAGYHIPQSMYDHWLSSVKEIAKRNHSNYRYQTYAMFLASLAGKPVTGSMNYVRENSLSKLDPLSLQFLATAYYLAGSKDMAEEVLKDASEIVEDYREFSGTYGSSLRDMAMMSYLATLRGDDRTASRLIQKVAKQFRPNGWYSTQEQCITIMAISNYYKKFGFNGGSVDVDMTIDGKKETLTVKRSMKRVPLNDAWGKKISLKTKTKDPLFISLVREGVPVEDNITTSNKGLKMARYFYDEDGREIELSDIRQGKPFWILYKVTSEWSEAVDEIALGSNLPAGWEIVNLRLNNERYPHWLGTISNGEHMDIRDDRINWFFDLPNRSSIKVAVKINPAFKGEYKLPPVIVEAMYSPDFYARIEGGKCSVK